MNPAEQWVILCSGYVADHESSAERYNGKDFQSFSVNVLKNIQH